jgi:hypothetical protein
MKEYVELCHLQAIQITKEFYSGEARKLRSTSELATTKHHSFLDSFILAGSYKKLYNHTHLVSAYARKDFASTKLAKGVKEKWKSCLSLPSLCRGTAKHVSL